ncbi:MAG TPA: tetratricopeptide repeat protein [Rhizomicrobium sp.]|nr:tetratricopeptide repeat protein [Rhizomicrobium sp.]
MSQAAAPPGLLTASLGDIARTLRADPRGAAQQAREYLRRFPGQREALRLLIAGRRLMGNAESARTLLQTLAKSQPELATLHYELGLLSREFDDAPGAAAAFARVTELEPLHEEAWRALGDVLADMGRQAEAASAYARHLDAWSTRAAKA